VAAGRGDPERAARLYGASAALRERHVLAPLPSEAAAKEAGLAAARAALGEPGFAAAWEEGHALTPEQAVACARGAQA
jgi:hypothetical protein